MHVQRMPHAQAASRHDRLLMMMSLGTRRVWKDLGTRFCDIRSTVAFRVSAHLCKCPPPIFDNPMVCVCIRHMYKWLLRVSTHPRFLAGEFKLPGALSWENRCSCLALLTGEAVASSARAESST